MPQLDLSPGNGLFYDYAPPGARGSIFVFVNALTGSTAMWEAEIAPALRDAGHGTLAYNFRGQADSPFTPGTELDQALIVDDLGRLLAEVEPPDPVLVGLSIGGLFAAGAYLKGASAAGLVLINTLRRAGPRLEWINAATLRAAQVGGLRLLMDINMPLLVNVERLQEIRADFLTEAPYEPLDPSHGHYNLLENSARADWNLPYERLDLPTLVMTGLQDRVFFDRDDVEALYARLPRARRLELRDAGHLIPVERPGATIKALLDFGRWLEDGTKP